MHTINSAILLDDLMATRDIIKLEGWCRGNSSRRNGLGHVTGRCIMGAVSAAVGLEHRYGMPMIFGRAGSEASDEVKEMFQRRIAAANYLEHFIESKQQYPHLQIGTRLIPWNDHEWRFKFQVVNLLSRAIKTLAEVEAAKQGTFLDTARIIASSTDLITPDERKIVTNGGIQV